MVAAGGLDGLEGSGEDPLLEGGVADAEGGCGFAGFEQDVYFGHGFGLLNVSSKNGKFHGAVRKIVM